ncbi:MAG: S-layer homology domain-containing protein [Candidatus Sericytochromatia bacterium]|nr:S-layer homology domain-containing protein [Candidatus Sericytochromatia bacterium]
MKTQTLLLSLLFSLHVLPAQAVQLVDAPRNNPALAARVQLAVDHFDILQAYPDRSFQGARPFTRYELADALQRSISYLARAHQVSAQVDVQSAAMFQAYLKPSGDIPRRHWAAPAVQQSMAFGLLSGGMDLRFHGGLKVSRYQLAQSAFQLLSWLQIRPVQLSAGASPRDLPAGHWASEAVQELVQAGILELDARGRFAGERPATRYELAETLVKTLEQIEIVARRQRLQPKAVVPLPGPLLRPRFDGRKPPFAYQGQP